MQTIVFTVFAKNYLPYARVLMDSVKRWNPQVGRVAFLVDRVDGYFDPCAEDFEIVSSEQLPIEASRAFHFKYSILELSTAIKPHAIRFLLDRGGVENVLYFDPDIRLHASLDSILSRLESHSFLLTPHLTSPLADERRPSELDILRSGAFNLGFIALRNCSESRDLLSWWQSRLDDHCRVDLANGLFVDQRWLDLAPGLFPGMGIVRDPGCNVAYWNLGHRRVEQGADRWLVNGEPLIFFHFSGFDAERPESISRYQNRFDLDSLNPPARRLFLSYAGALLERGYAECKKWPYAYGAFSNGEPIPDVARSLGYSMPDATADPFSDSGYQDVVRSATASPRGGVLRPLAAAIYDSRPDLQRAFPDPDGEDRARFLRWLLTFGAMEHGLSQSFLEPFRQDWESTVSAIPSALERLRHRSLLAVCNRKLKSRFLPSPLSKDAQSEPNGRANRSAFGINFVGYVRSEMGVGESVRCAIRAARAAEFAFSVKSVDRAGGPYRLMDGSVADNAASGLPYLFNIFHVNADQTPSVMLAVQHEIALDRFNVGYWAWELEEFPARWAPSFGYFREVWTPSSFCADAIARASPVPVLRVPHAVHVNEIAALDRSDFGIPEDRFAFLHCFDLMSGFERKNPLGAIAAFRAAFQGDASCHLVLKVNHAELHTEQMEQIRQASAGLPVTILERTIGRADLNALMNCCDCLISLHRSEGFGLTMAEAMFLGKPVIATAYSGNLDFTREDNSFLVRFKMTTVAPGCQPYDKGLRWADPDTDHAAEQMRIVFRSAETRTAKAHRGREFVRRELAPRAVGAMMRRRLELLHSRLN
ncbi:MAG TPA: glycosyltransferase [Bryobacteraceae bacterium]|jgi:glycosyltransferase involved in cell wall biosynthesis